MAFSKMVKIGDKDVRLKASADTPRMYRQLFGRDLFHDMNKLNLRASESNIDMGNTEVLENICYTMAKQADASIPDIDEWLDQFDMFDVFYASKDVLEMWTRNISTMSTAKKK